jgi:hypothetical protein
MLRRILLAALLLASPATAAEDPAIEEVRAAYAACTAHVDAQPDNWFGWRRVHDGGYADLFEFWDQGADGYGPSVLKRRYLIDGIASEEQTFCYRPDGTLAFVYVEMVSPDMAQGLDAPSLTREGRIYVDPTGQVVRVLGKVVGEENGTPFETTLDDPEHQLARGCWQLDLALTRDRVYAAYLHEMGDIDGNYPDYRSTEFAWCLQVE